MTFDKKLIQAVRKAVSGCSEGRLAYVEELIHQWQTECLLSRGPDPNRCKHWEQKAAETKDYLEAMAGTEPVKCAERRWTGKGKWTRNLALLLALCLCASASADGWQRLPRPYERTVKHVPRYRIPCPCCTKWLDQRDGTSYELVNPYGFAWAECFTASDEFQVDLWIDPWRERITILGAWKEQ